VHYRWAVITMILTMLTPPLSPICLNLGRAIISVQCAIFILPFYYPIQAARRCLSSQLTQHLVGWVTVYQTVKTIRVARPNMQFIVLPVHDWALSKLLRRYVGLMSPAIWLIVGHWLLTTLGLGYWKITDPCHYFYSF
jgi:hypothetical protein